MAEPEFRPYQAIATGLLSAGGFSVIYPAIVKAFAPSRVFAPHHVIFFFSGLVLLGAGAAVLRVGQIRHRKE